MRATTINPAILIWARETAGLRIEEAAQRLGLEDSQRATAEEKLAAWETGNASPTHAQLLKLAGLYRRPLTTFYLSAPPLKGDRGQDFRTLDVEVSAKDNALLDAVLRDIRARQEIVRSSLEESDEVRPLSFIASVKVSDGVERVCGLLREALQVTPHMQKAAGDPKKLFALLRASAERLGAFVLLVGDGGSYHTTLDERVFRGFALSDPVAPFVVINDRDAQGAKSFTLLHELTHLWLGVTGVSGAPTLDETTPSSRVERFCNDVASEFLVPRTELQKHLQRDYTTVEDVLVSTQEIAKIWNVSQTMVAYRFHVERRVPDNIWREVATVLADRWRALRMREREIAKENEGGPTYYITKRSKLGKALVSAVERAVRSEVLSYTKAAKVLGVKATNVEPLFRQ